MQRAKIIETDLNFKGLDNRRVTDMIVIHHTGNPTDDDLFCNEAMFLPNFFCILIVLYRFVLKNQAWLSIY